MNIEYWLEKRSAMPVAPVRRGLKLGMGKEYKDSLVAPRAGA